MRHNHITTLALGVAALTGLLTSCSGDAATADKVEPVVVESIPGSDLMRVTLTPDAAERISLETGEVSAGEGTELKIPYGALIYDPDGNTWVYVLDGELTFVRAAVDIDRIDGDLAFATSGPEIGSSVAIVGVVELFGAETGIGK